MIYLRIDKLLSKQAISQEEDKKFSLKKVIVNGQRAKIKLNINPEFDCIDVMMSMIKR